MAITILPKSNDVPDMGASDEMSFSVGTYDWGEYYSFAKPVIPDAAPTS